MKKRKNKQWQEIRKDDVQLDEKKHNNSITKQEHRVNEMKNRKNYMSLGACVRAPMST